MFGNDTPDTPVDDTSDATTNEEIVNETATPSMEEAPETTETPTEEKPLTE